MCVQETGQAKALPLEAGERKAGWLWVHWTPDELNWPFLELVCGGWNADLGMDFARKPSHHLHLWCDGTVVKLDCHEGCMTQIY